MIGAARYWQIYLAWSNICDYLRLLKLPAGQGLQSVVPGWLGMWRSAELSVLAEQLLAGGEEPAALADTRSSATRLRSVPTLSGRANSPVSEEQHGWRAAEPSQNGNQRIEPERRRTVVSMVATEYDAGEQRTTTGGGDER